MQTAPLDFFVILEHIPREILLCLDGQSQPPPVPGTLSKQEQIYRECHPQIFEEHDTIYQCTHSPHILYGPCNSPGRYAEQVLLSPFTERDNK